MTSQINQDPEQKARDIIDSQLELAGWKVQGKDNINLSAFKGVAVREYQTDAGFVDYVLFVDRKPLGVIEAKRESEGVRLTIHEDQAEDYARSKLKYLNNDPLPFIYESTGEITRFTNHKDPKPRSRPVFSFHKPETLMEWFNKPDTLRERLQNTPPLIEDGLRAAQIRAIKNLERSFSLNHPKALIQMATGAGKTYTACTFVYRLLKHAKAKRILFLVDTRNLGEQAEQEFLRYQPRDDNRKFTELYNVQRLASSHIASDSQVCISTIQRLYSILQGKDLEEELEEENPHEKSWMPKEPKLVEYNPDYPIEEFDFIIVDECHRSIYNLWKQVLDYFDAFIIGLTATPDKRTFGFFNENVVSEYSYEDSVADGVNVPYDVFTIETEITQNGADIKAKEFIEKREKLSRRRRWSRLDDDYAYTAKQLDRDVVNPSQIRNVIRAFKDCLPKIFPERYDENNVYEVPKTLVFAKSDSHADDIIQIIREEFGEGNDFCKKITYKSKEDPKSVLNRFRNSWAPRIAVTVDMVATGTDVRPLEILLFMRDVRSVNYFEQMKGRGTRVINFEDLKRVTRTAKNTKTHYVLIDAVGVTKSTKTDSRPLERKPSMPLKDLLSAVTMGAKEEDIFVSLADRLARLEKQITDDEKRQFEKVSGGENLNHLVKDLLDAHDPDIIEDKTKSLIEDIPKEEQTPAKEEDCRKKAREELAEKAASHFNGRVNDFIENVRRKHEQIIDTVNLDSIRKAEWNSFTKKQAKKIVGDFKEYLLKNKDEIEALSIFYDQPYRMRELSFRMIKEVLDKLKLDKPNLAPEYVWNAWTRLESINVNSPKDELVALVSLIRRVTDIDDKLTPFDRKVHQNFKDWVFTKHSGAGEKFTEEQMNWLKMIRDHISTSIHIEMEDLDYSPFDASGGRGRMQQLFGDKMDDIIKEMNEALVA